MIVLSHGGIIHTDHIALIASIHSEPIKRLVNKLPEESIFNLTYGYPRQAVIVLTNGYIAIVSQSVEELATQITNKRSDDAGLE